MFNLDFSVHALWGGPHKSPLYDWQTRTVWPKYIKIENSQYQKLISKWTIPLNVGVSCTVLLGYLTLTSSILTSYPHFFLAICPNRPDLGKTPTAPPTWHSVARRIHIILLPSQNASEQGVNWVISHRRIYASRLRWQHVDLHRQKPSHVNLFVAHGFTVFFISWQISGFEGEGWIVGKQGSVHPAALINFMKCLDERPVNCLYMFVVPVLIRCSCVVWFVCEWALQFCVSPAVV